MVPGQAPTCAGCGRDFLLSGAFQKGQSPTRQTPVLPQLRTHVLLCLWCGLWERRLRRVTPVLELGVLWLWDSVTQKGPWVRGWDAGCQGRNLELAMALVKLNTLKIHPSFLLPNSP